jgi:hypothetical protein
MVGGEFLAFNATPRSRLAALNMDGTVNTGFDNGQGGPNGLVTALAVQADGKVLLGGVFTAVNGQVRNRIVRLNNDGSLDTVFGQGLSGANNSVVALALQGDGKVLVGGTFTSINGVARNRVARLNPDGTRSGGSRLGLGRQCPRSSRRREDRHRRIRHSAQRNDSDDPHPPGIQRFVRRGLRRRLGRD